MRYQEKLKSDKLAGRAAPKKKPQVVEQHFDDCGSDFGPISCFDIDLRNTFELEPVNNTLDPFVLEQLHHLVHPFFGFVGCDVEDSYSQTDPKNIVQYDDLLSFLHDARFPQTGYVDVAELCGGGALTTKLLVRRGYVGGANFDIVVGFDLDSTAGKSQFFDYIKRCKPYVLIMGPPCTGMKGFKELNKILHPESYWRSRLRSERIGTTAGIAATMQMDAGRHFFVEQPYGSDLFTLPVWVRLSLRVAWCRVQQCAAGLVGIRTGRPIRKDSEFWASDERLLAYVRRFVCKCIGIHAAIGRDEPSKCAQVWPLALCRGIARGCVDVLSDKRGLHALFLQKEPLFYEASTGTLICMTWDFFPVDVRTFTCPACVRCVVKTDVSHTRDPDTCKFPDVEAVVWTCPACIASKPLTHRGHTMKLSECRGATTPHAGRMRTREPKVPASAEPSSSMRQGAPDPDSIEDVISDFQAEQDREAEAAAAAAQRREDFARSSGVDLNTGAAELQNPTPELAVAAGSSSGSLLRDALQSQPAVAVPPAPGARPDGRRAVATTETQADNTAGDWQAFDLGKAIRLLHSKDDGVIRRTLRRLHVRFWHASTRRLTELLRKAGAPDAALKLVATIVETCRTCRMWTRPTARSMTRVSLAQDFNQMVQWDILFYKDVMLSHMMDEATRWCSFVVLASKEAVDILDCILMQWITIFGPMKILITDSESSLKSDEAAQFADRHSIQLKPVPKYAHADMIERHHEIVRQLCHRVEDECERQGLGISRKHLLAECVFAKNALVSVGGQAPYTAVFGRTPAIMAEFEPTSETQLVDDEGGTIGISRNHLRLREIAIQSMVDLTAKQRLDRALASKTRPTGEAKDLKQGDQIEFFRRGATKDESGWRGPATYLDQDGGQHSIRWQGRHLSVRTQDVRRALIYLVFLTQDEHTWPRGSSPHGLLWSFVDGMRSECFRLGWVYNNGWRRAKASASLSDVVLAILFVASNGIHLQNCIGARLGHGMSTLPPLEDVDSTVLVWWRQGQPRTVWHTDLPGSVRVKLHEITAEWQHTCFIQFLAASSDDVEDIQDLEPEVAVFTPPRQVIRNQYRSPAPTLPSDRSMVHTPTASTPSTHHSTPYAPSPPGHPPWPPRPATPATPSTRRGSPMAIDDIDMHPQPRPQTVRWTPEVDDRDKRKRSHLTPGSSASTPGRSTRPPAHIYRRLADTPSPAQGAATASAGSPAPSTIPYGSPHSPGVASTVGYSPQPVSPQPAPVLPAVAEDDYDFDDGDYLDADSQEVREYDDKDKFFVDDLNGAMPLEGLDHVRCPPDPQHYCAGLSGAHSSFYDVPATSDLDSEPLEISISGYLRHWYTGVADHMDVVDDAGKTVGRSNGIHAIENDRDFVVRYYATGRKEVVIEREMNILTLAEAMAHVDEVTQAMRDELKRWVSCGGFRRFPRKLATNCLDSRWVLKWKLVDGKRVIKARLTVRGYKDLQGAEVKTMATTASRWGQRVVCMAAVQNDWVLYSADVSQAFLKGMSFDEVAKLKGEVKRHVQFDTPPGSIPILRMLDGYEDFDGGTEVLEMLRGGFGLKDAPRLWNMVFSEVLTSLQYFPCQSDMEVMCKHVTRNGKLTLVGLVAKHVDDVKGASEEDERELTLKALEDRFGKLKRELNAFDNVGISFEQNLAEHYIRSHQGNYIRQVREMTVDSAALANPETDCDKDQHATYLSLVGALAWCVLTIPAIAVYIAYLQRQVAAPKISHCRDANRLVRYLHKLVKDDQHALMYHKLNGPLVLYAVGDSAFSAGEFEGLALRGGFVLVAERGADGKPKLGGKCQVLDYYCRKHSRVCRSTFTAELHNLIDICNQALLVRSMLVELEVGPKPPGQLAEIVDTGLHMISVEGIVDARAVYDAVTADVVKTPDDKHMLLHALKLREWLDRGAVRALWWCDTLDMIADGMTKGSIDREDILGLCKAGIWTCNRENVRWSSIEKAVANI